MLHDAGIPFVIIGHSERRTLFHETSEVAAKKTKAALECGVKVILCVGETLEERESGRTNEVIQSQLKPVIETLSEEEWRWNSTTLASILIYSFVQQGCDCVRTSLGDRNWESGDISSGNQIFDATSGFYPIYATGPRNSAGYSRLPLDIDLQIRSRKHQDHLRRKCKRKELR